MRICVMSDLHLEFERSSGPASPTRDWFALRAARRAHPDHPQLGPWLADLRGAVDLVLLAGDIDVGAHGIRYAAGVQRYLGAPVAYVAGNHEFYDGDIADARRKLAEAAVKAGVIFLDDTRLDTVIGGRRVIVLGSTLWTDYALDGGGETDVAWAMRAAAGGLNDHVRISLGAGKWTPDDARRQHLSSRAWLAAEVVRVRAESDGDTTALVIVTHHAPLREASPPGQDRGGVAAAYASDMTAEITAWAPDLWLWGHVHWPADSRRGQTRLVSAPRGYVGVEPGADRFRPPVIEL